MRVLIDIGHPAHVHFFRRPIEILREHGHEILITSRLKEIAGDLLDAYGMDMTRLMLVTASSPRQPINWENTGKMTVDLCHLRLLL